MARPLILIAALAVLVLLIVVGQRPDPERVPLSAVSETFPDDEWFQAAVLDRPGLVLVDFTAAWCGPCRRLAPLLDQLQQEFEGSLEVVKVDIDKHPEVAVHYGAPPIPLMLLMHQGKVLGGLLGAVEYERLRQFVEPHLNVVDADLSEPGPPR